MTDFIKCLLDVFARLQEGLGRVPERSSLAEGPGDGSVIQWEDEDYLYLDVDLRPGATDIVDICIYRGHAFIRMAKYMPLPDVTPDGVSWDSP
jgi:hypothetical protein